ncbi:LacI family DNA-binding transcriptional regulator [Candidatus Aerophobetes bacterium]|nr:LacI family DNA-binding transcriptional regulator [Candidatus Aerophobetes bacterium]
MGITIRDVAKLAGVAVSTASLALNNKERVSEATRKKVIEAARKLNYYPSSIAKRFALNKTHTIALCAFISGEHPLGGFYMPVIQGIINVVNANNYSFQLDIKGEHKNSSTKREILTRLAKYRLADGLIILSHWPLQVKEILDLEQMSFPYVVVDGHIPGIDVNCVEMDNFGGSLKSVEYLIGLGHRRIGFITGPPNQQSSIERIKGFQEALRKNRIDYDKSLIFPGDFHKKSGREGMKYLLSLPSPPSAVFVANDNMALAAIKVIKEKGLKIPEDISIVGFDDIEAASQIDPPLTTVRQPLYKMGEESTKLLFNLLNNKEDKPRKILLDTRLVIRESCRAL